MKIITLSTLAMLTLTACGSDTAPSTLANYEATADALLSKAENLEPFVGDLPTEDTATYNGLALIIDYEQVSDLTLVADFGVGDMSGTADNWIDANTGEVLSGSVDYYAPALTNTTFETYATGVVDGNNSDATLITAFGGNDGGQPDMVAGINDGEWHAIIAD